MMSKHLLIFLFVFVVMGPMAFCQYRLGNETYQYFSIGGGIGFYQNKDLLLIPTRFNGAGLNIHADYTLDQPRTFQKAKFQLDFGGEQNRTGYHGVFIFHQLTYAFFYQLLPKTRLYAGAKLYGGTNDHFYYGLDDGHLYWLTTYNVQGSLMYILDLKHGRQWMADANVVLAGMVSRPEAESYVSNFKNNALWKDVNSNFSFAAIGQLFRIETGLQYQLDKANGLRYDIGFYTYPDPEAVTFLSHSISYVRKLGTNRGYR